MAVAAWLLVAASLLFVSSVSADSKNNPADKLVSVLNSNRTASKLPALEDNPGLGCIALQYIKAYQGRCDEVGGSDAKKPSDAEFAQTFAPNCGVQVSTLRLITSRLLGCQSEYVTASEAFSSILMRNERGLQILRSKNHTEVGAAVSGTDGGAPYFWCVLFSGGKSNNSFVLEGGEAKKQHPGCFSGTNDDCSGAHRHQIFGGALTIGISVAVGLAFGL
ncbi:hypothetical protein Scep_007964 [Stephania cephalantha]|uniref:Ferredoxin-like protein n=1 Tax=Stephania cephalantha TaxID=152367 RepID=A0AAP0KDH9_9MAGN